MPVHVCMDIGFRIPPASEHRGFSDKITECRFACGFACHASPVLDRLPEVNMIDTESVFDLARHSIIASHLCQQSALQLMKCGESTLLSCCCPPEPVISVLEPASGSKHASHHVHSEACVPCAMQSEI